jgi:predicted nucleic acid-binding protein
LSKAAAGDPRAVAWIARARELQLPLVVNAVTLTESIRGGGRDARVHLLTKNARVDTVDGDFAAEAGRLLGRTGRSDTVDALVATTAIRLKQPTTILTSDPRDLQSLTSEHPLVRVVPV